MRKLLTSVFGVALVSGMWVAHARASEGAVAAPAASSSAPPLQRLAPAGAPNVVVVLLDDVGFGASSTFGGPAATPMLDGLAKDGLRYNRFHTTAICSPTRAALLSGRNAHAVGVGTVLNIADSRPGYNGVFTKDAATIAEVLRQAGYSTAAFGKWHLAPDWEISQSGPFDRWPTGQGFEKFYGFLGGETDQFEPTLVEGTKPILRPAGKDYHLTTDLTDHTIEWIRAQHAMTPDKPFFAYFAPGATHAPLHVPKEWIDKYRGKFDQGWDAMREQTLARQKKLGVVPANTVLTSRPAGLPEWDSLSADQKKIAARLMEVYAGFMAHTDAQIGRLVQSLKDSGEYDNTLFIYIVGDNGASPEGMLSGTLNNVGILQGFKEDQAKVLARLNDIGGPTTSPLYPVAWAWAMNTPFQFTKQAASHLGGTRNPMVITWPKRITDRGGLRSQFGHVNDIMPTILEVTGLQAPSEVNGIQQKPMNGVSLAYSFADAKAPERHTTQYFEVMGNRAIYHNGWMASALHRVPWGTVTEDTPFDRDKWELYNLRTDFSQSKDLAAQEPQRLEAMKALFMHEATANNVLPLKGPTLHDPALPSLTANRTAFTFYPGTVGVPEAEAPKIINRSWSLAATVDVAATGARGVISTLGGAPAGWSLYLDDQGRPVFTYRLFDVKTVDLVGSKPLSSGRHLLQVDFDYDGSGYAKGGELRLQVDGAVSGHDRLPASPPLHFSISETFDIGVDTGSVAGHYPADAAIGYPFEGGQIERVDVRLR